MGAVAIGWGIMTTNLLRRLNNLERAMAPPEAERVAVVIYDHKTGKTLTGEPDPRAELLVWMPHNWREPLPGVA